MDTTNTTQTTTPTDEMAQMQAEIAAADHSGEKKYTEAEMQRALRGLARFFMAAAVEQISDTGDLSAYLEHTSAFTWRRAQEWISAEQGRAVAGRL